MTRRDYLPGLLVLLIAMDVLLPLVAGPVQPPLWLHHLEHAFLMVTSGALGIARVQRRPGPYGNPGWLFAVVGLSILSLPLMLPDVYGSVDAHPLLHAALHLGFVGLGYLGGFAAESYSDRSGIAWLLLVAMMGVITATGFGMPGPHA